jgi:hypothetical protein
MPGRDSAPPPVVCPRCRGIVRQVGPTLLGEGAFEAWPGGAWRWQGGVWRRVGKGNGSFRLHPCTPPDPDPDEQAEPPPQPEQLALV